MVQGEDTLKEVIRLEKENNKILLKLYKTQKLNLVIKTIYWFILIGIAIGAFYFLQPFLDNITQIYKGGTDSLLNFLN